MSTVMINIIGRLLVAGICAAASGALAYAEKDGWGWFLFAALLLGCITVKTNATGSAEVSE